MSPPKHAEVKDPLFVTTDDMEIGPTKGEAVDDGTQGTSVTQESEKTDGDSKKRRREDGAEAVNIEKEEEEEMKRQAGAGAVPSSVKLSAKLSIMLISSV